MLAQRGELVVVMRASGFTRPCEIGAVGDENGYPHGYVTMAIGEWVAPQNRANGA